VIFLGCSPGSTRKDDGAAAAREALKVRVAATRNCGPVLIVDADDADRAELAQLFEAAGYLVTQAATGEEALDAAREEMPSAVVLEVPLGAFSGYEVCRTLRRTFGDELPIIFLSGSRTESYDRVAGLLVGADDYLVKPYAGDELLARLRRLLRRSHPLSNGATANLTKREREILGLLAEGLQQDAIAERLFISPKTVGTHIEHILSKLNVRSRAQAVALAYRDELVDVAQ
jgi:DNA-binding NarL/FixJ family response regulator